MNDCLVSTLKGGVNAEVTKFGELVFFINTDTAVSAINFSIEGDAEVRVFDGVGEIGKTNALGSTSLTYEGGGNSLALYFGAGNYKIGITSKYKLKGMGDVSGYSATEKNAVFDTDDLEFGINTTGYWINAAQIKDGVLDMKKQTQKYFMQIDNPNNISYEANLDDFVNAGENFIGLLANNNRKITGHITTLGYLKKLQHLQLEKGSVSGEVNDLVQALFNAGKTSGTCTLKLVGTNCTDDGNLITASYISGKGGTSNIVLSFTGSGYTKSYS